MISIVVDTSTPTLLFSIVENNEIKYLYNSKLMVIFLQTLWLLLAMHLMKLTLNLMM